MLVRQLMPIEMSSPVRRRDAVVAGDAAIRGLEMRAVVLVRVEMRVASHRPRRRLLTRARLYWAHGDGAKDDAASIADADHGSGSEHARLPTSPASGRRPSSPTARRTALARAAVGVVDRHRGSRRWPRMCIRLLSGICICGHDVPVGDRAAHEFPVGDELHHRRPAAAVSAVLAANVLPIAVRRVVRLRHFVGMRRQLDAGMHLEEAGRRQRSARMPRTSRTPSTRRRCPRPGSRSAQ